jgi:NADPH:quinone reductase-like Zn-dependent oxidoreductase
MRSRPISNESLDLVRSIGADHVIDYTERDFTKGEPEYDLILDNVGTHSLKDMRRVLTADGLLLANGAPAPTGWFGALGHPRHGTTSDQPSIHAARKPVAGQWNRLRDTAGRLAAPVRVRLDTPARRHPIRVQDHAI